MKSKRNKNMKTHIMVVLLSASLYAPLASADEKATTPTADRISVFKVPLVCPAAPQIGCGSASKPILLDLEKQPGVLEALVKSCRNKNRRCVEARVGR
jgi:hypothetical protein